MIRLYAPTLSIRATVDQQARIILPPEVIDPKADLKNHYRQVTVLVPASPNIFMGIDLDVEKDFGVGGVGPNRTFMVPAIPGGQIIPFRLQPQQKLLAMAEIGQAFITVICEYVEDF